MLGVLICCVARAHSNSANNTPARAAQSRDNILKNVVNLGACSSDVLKAHKSTIQGEHNLATKKIDTFEIQRRERER